MEEIQINPSTSMNVLKERLDNHGVYYDASDIAINIPTKEGIVIQIYFTIPVSLAQISIMYDTNLSNFIIGIIDKDDKKHVASYKYSENIGIKNREINTAVYII